MFQEQTAEKHDWKGEISWIEVGCEIVEYVGTSLSQVSILSWTGTEKAQDTVLKI